MSGPAPERRIRLVSWWSIARLRLAPRGLGRSLLLAACVGAVAGIGAVAFQVLSHGIGSVALGRMAGYWPDGPAHETGMPPFLAELLPEEGEAPSSLRWWALPLVLGAGGLLSGALVYGLAPEAEGHGTDAAIDAYHNGRGVIRGRVPLVKALASAITLGTGGSGGREGPIAQIGAGFGSVLGRRLGLPESQCRTLLAAGVGAGIGSIFHAPLAGAIFAIEVLYRDPDFEAENLIPAFISTTVAYSVFAFVFGLEAFRPLFAVDTSLVYTRPFALLLPLAVLALLMAAAAQGYVRTFYGVHDLFRRLPIPRVFRPALGAAGAGLVALGVYFALPGADGEMREASLGVLQYGYGFLQRVLRYDQAPVAVSLLVLVAAGKVVTTSLTIGSGGSGGVFGPSMVIGGSLGGIVGIVFHALAPGLVSHSEVVVFAILGMASFFAAAAKTPVSTLIMVSELTGSYALLPPAMWVCALAYVVSGHTSLYREQVTSRLDSPAHRGDFIVDVLKGIPVAATFQDGPRPFETVPVDMPLSGITRLITRTLQSTYPVVDAEGRYQGLLGLDDVREFLYDRNLGPVAIAQDLANEVEPLTLQMDLSLAISRFAQERFEELPVVDDAEPDKVVGMLRRRDLIHAYDRQLLSLRTPPARASSRSGSAAEEQGSR